tara:strand:+ start:54 stop:380 length:327 start_codon:yes stop_codon:yes gene_type:complete
MNTKSKFSLVEWQESFGESDYIISNLDIPHWKYENYKLGITPIPNHIKFACLYLSLMDKLFEDGVEKAPRHPMRGLGLERLRRDLLEGINSSGSILSVHTEPGQELWK